MRKDQLTDLLRVIPDEGYLSYASLSGCAPCNCLALFGPSAPKDNGYILVSIPDDDDDESFFGNLKVAERIFFHNVLVGYVNRYGSDY